MNIPNLPTDNLYKFMALSGLVIFLLATIYPILYFDKISDEVFEIGTEMGILDIEQKQIQEKLNDLKEKQGNLKKSIKRYNIEEDTTDSVIDIGKLKEKFKDPDHRQYKEFMYKYRSEIFPEVGIGEELLEQGIENADLSYKLGKKVYLISRKTDLIDIKNKKINRELWKWRLIQAIGVLISIVGFYFWYYRVQKLLDNKLKNELSNN